MKTFRPFGCGLLCRKRGERVTECGGGGGVQGGGAGQKKSK